MKRPFVFAPWTGARFALLLGLGLAWGGGFGAPTTLRGQTTELPAAAPATDSATPAAGDPAAPVGPRAVNTPRRGTGTGAAASVTDASDQMMSHAREGPIDISSIGDTSFVQTPQGRVAIASRGVRIQTNDTSIYCDHAEYNADTHEADLTGNVRIYRLDTAILASHAVYNFDTKAVRALDFNGARPPYEFGGVSGFSPGAGAEYTVRRGVFTTDDSSQPDFHIDARRIRIYPDNRIIFIGGTLYIGATPTFYFPYFYQSLDQQSGFTVTPGYTSEFGAYLLTGVTFPITEHLTGLARVDYRTSRGIGLGLNVEYKPNRKVKTPPDASSLPAYASDDNPGVAAAPQSAPVHTGTGPSAAGSAGVSGDEASSDDGHQPGFALTGEERSKQIRSREDLQLITYYVHDDKPDENRTALDRLPVDSDRYRIKLAGTTFITDDLFFKIDADKLSDRYMLQDFYEGEFTTDPNPENILFATFYQPTFVTTLIGRVQANNFFDTTERLPELDFDVPRLPLWNSGFYYESENSAGYLRRTFDSLSPLPEYSAGRFDTFHQFTYPRTFFDWLSVVPRVGFRATYYTHDAPASTPAYNLMTSVSSTSDEALFAANDPTDLDYVNLKTAIKQFRPGGSILRPVVDAGLEVSFKLSRVYDDVESRAFGLDQIQHVIQPYANFLEVEDFGITSRQLLQFDRRLPSTQLQPIDFPQQTTIDSIDAETVVRLGVRNRLQTKRDALTFNWLETDTYFQVGNDPNERGNISNVFNNITFRPLPWVTATLDSQLPIFNPHSGFTEVDSSIEFQATRNLDVTISHRYLNDNPFFANSSLLRFNVYYRLDENWAAAFSERYEFAQHQLQAQSYTIYRDLSAFVGSLGLTVRDNNGIEDVGIALNFTLKGIPKVSLPVGFDVNSVANQLTQ